jgi:thioesterase domain-containing protein
VGGNVLVFAKLAKLLGPDQPFYGLQTKGLDGEEEPYTSIRDMATHYITEIRSVRPEGPYFIGGTCTGGVVAYEIAQQLVAQGEQVTLVIMESWHPSSYRNHQRKPPMLLWTLLFLWTKVSEYAETLAKLPMKDRGTFFHGKLKKISAVLSGKAQETLRDSAFDVERVKQATFLAVSRYNTDTYPGDLLNVIASKRPLAEGTLDTRAVWATLAQGECQTIYLPAEDSGRLFVSPHVEELSRQLSRYIASESQQRADQSNSSHDDNSDTQTMKSVA